MQRIIPPIRPNDSGPAVANLQEALLFIATKRQFIPDGIAPPDWKRKLEDNQELGGQLFGNATLQLLLGVLRELLLPTADFVNDAIAAALNHQLEELGAFQPESRDGNYVVGGIVRVGKLPAANLVVTAYDQDLPSKRNARQLLGSNNTNADGYYRITYIYEAFASGEGHATGGAKPDLLVVVSDSDRKTLAESDLRPNANPNEIVDFDLSPREHRGPPEFERLTNELLPITGEVTFAKLTDKDIEFLGKETEWSHNVLLAFRDAHRFAEEYPGTEAKPAIFHGLFRQGLPADAALLLEHRQAEFAGALLLSSSPEQNLIPPLVPDEVPVIVERMIKGLARRFGTAANGQVSPLSLVLASVLDVEEQRTAFVEAYNRHDGLMKVFVRTPSEDSNTPTASLSATGAIRSNAAILSGLPHTAAIEVPGEDLGDWRIETTKTEIDSFLNRLEIVGSNEKVETLADALEDVFLVVNYSVNKVS